MSQLSATTMNFSVFQSGRLAAILYFLPEQLVEDVWHRACIVTRSASRAPCIHIDIFHLLCGLGTLVMQQLLL
jgi:hypothetical protein